MEEGKDRKQHESCMKPFAADLSNAESTSLQDSCKFKSVVLKVWSLEQQCQHYPEIWQTREFLGIISDY